MRRFVRQVHKETMDIPANYRYTSAEFNEVMGSVDQLVFQFIAVKVSGTSPIFTADLQGSNNGVDWTTLETIFNGVALSPATINTAVVASTKDLPAFVRLGMFMGGTTPSADILIIACGRDSTN